MTYPEFLDVVHQHNFSVAALRCDVPPSDAILDLIDVAGKNYERFVRKYSTVESTSLTIGETVKFRTPNDDEIDDHFIVIEPRGDRVLVQYICDLTIKPTFVYLTADLEPVTE